jgi:hypothetical protein
MAAEMLVELRDGETRVHRRVGLGVQGGIIQRAARVCRVRVLIHCRRSL